MRRFARQLGVLALLLVACSPQGQLKSEDRRPVAIPVAKAKPSPSEAQFLEEHKKLVGEAADMDREAFLKAYPAPQRVEALHYDPLKAEGLEKILKKYPLTATQRAALKKNGFVVVPNAPTQVHEHVYKDVYHGHLPVMVTSDSVLYALHRSYDALLQDLEKDVLVPELSKMLGKMHSNLATRNGRGEFATPARGLTANDVDVYIAVARSLLSGKSVAPKLPSSDPAQVARILAAAKLEKPAVLGLFGEEVDYDYSQLKPRGHYNTPTLKRYFQAMMWIGRTELPLVSFKKGQAKFKTHAFSAALLMTELLEKSGALDHWSRIDKVVSTFVGEKDSMDPVEMRRFATDVSVPAWTALSPGDSTKLRDGLLATDYGTQRIQSQILKSNPHDPEAIQLPRVFQLMGQRFTVDSHILSRSVYDRLIDPDTGKKIRRMLPRDLDVQFALGSNAAAQELDAELKKYNYAHRLHELRYVVDSYSKDFWTSNIYNAWLGAIRGLNDTTHREYQPESMRTRAWDLKNLNTQMASWAELRHDTLLYAKQSYSASISCEYPNAYVEPVPVFWQRMNDLAKVGMGVSTGLEKDGFKVTKAKAFFEKMDTATAMLRSIARKQLERKPLSGKEKKFLKATVEIEMVGCGETHYDGWFPALFYRQSDVAHFKPTIADVHTAPTDAFQNPVGWVLHAGTGAARTLIMTVNHGKTSHAFVGPVSSYYSFHTEKFKRLDDTQWAQKLMSATSR